MAFKEWLSKIKQRKFDKNFEDWLKRNTLNAEALIDLKSAYGADMFTYQVQENMVWSTGNAELIRYFYQNANLKTDFSFFWQQAPNNVIKRHTGIPKLISSAMSNVLMGNDFKTTVSIYNVDEEGKTTDTLNEGASQMVEEELSTLFDKTKFFDKIHSQAFIDSWCGHSFLKFNYDLNLSNYPILEVYDLTKAKVIKERGITTAIVFSSWYESKNKRYRHDEIYTTDENGDATVVNKLYEIRNNEENEVALTTLLETAKLLPEYHFEGLKGMIAFEKPNKMPNYEYPNSYYGASDYQGAIDVFDSMDEVFSEFISETRMNKTLRYIPDSMIPRDERGNPNDSFLSWVTNYVKISADQDQGASNNIDIQQVLDKTDSLKAKFDKLLCLALNHAGLSPLAIGTTGLEAINAGEASQKERNRVTVETRKTKLSKYWIPYLKDVTIQLIAFNNWLLKTAGVRQDSIQALDVDFDNMDVSFDFGEYVVENPDSVYSRVAAAKQSGIMSIEEAVRKIHPEWNDDQILEEVTKIKFENNISVDDPSILQFDEGALDQTPTEAQQVQEEQTEERGTVN